MKVDLKGLFTPQAIAAQFKLLPPQKTTIIDRAFNSTVNHPFPTLGVNEVLRVTGTVPFVRRSGNPIKLGGDVINTQIFAPVPIMPSIEITASELNDLKMILGNEMSRDAWVRTKLDDLRNVVRNTTEAISSVVLTTGKYSWAMRLDGGTHETFEIDFGEPHALTPALFTDSTKLSVVFDLLSEMAEKIENAGFTGEIKFFAGKKAFAFLLNLANLWVAGGSASPINVKLESNTISIGGYIIERMVEKYQSPLNKSQVAKIADENIVAYCVTSDSKIYYCAIDSISADNKALPFHVFTKEVDDRAIELQAQAKPVPVRSPKSVCIAKVVG